MKAYLEGPSPNWGKIQLVGAFAPLIGERIWASPASVRSALLDEDPDKFGRWLFSAVLAACLHGAIAMAVLAWQVTSRTFSADGWSRSSEAVFIDLTPLPARQSPEWSLPRLEPGSDRGLIPLERARHGPQEGSAVSRNNSAEPAGLQRSEAAPVPPDTASDTGNSGAVASDAFAAGAVEKSPPEVSHGLRVDPGPLDTSITVLPPLHPHKSFGIFDRNRMILLRPMVHPGKGESSHSNPLSHGPGARIQDRVNAALEREKLRGMERARNGSAVPGTNSLGMKNRASSTVHDSTKNALGETTVNNGNGNVESSVVNGSTRNAVGMTIQVHPAPHSANIDEHREGIAGVKAREGIAGLKTAVPPGNAGLMAATSPPGILNGRGAPRLGTSLSVLGGAPKTVPGSLSGSDFHPKHQQ